MNELEKSKFQNEQEYEDAIRLKVIYEELAAMHSRICNEEFRTRAESREMLDVVQAFSRLQVHFNKNHEKRKEQYYNDGCTCDYPDSL